MEQEKKLIKIGDLAEKAGVTVRTIRYYEELGLLSPSQISPGGFRLYSESDLRKLNFIKRFKNLDFSLDEILRLIDVPTSGVGKSERISLSVSILQRQLEKVESKMKELEDLKDEINQAVELLHECDQCQKDTCLNECPNREALI